MFRNSSKTHLTVKQVKNHVESKIEYTMYFEYGIVSINLKQYIYCAVDLSNNKIEGI